MSGLEALAARCEAATGPDRELDTAIVTAMGGFTVLWNPLDPDQGFDAPAYTASLDAAMTLVPDGWTCCEISMKRIGTGYDRTRVELSRLVGEHEEEDYRIAHAKTPALALCAAALRAHLATDGGKTNV